MVEKCEEEEMEWYHYSNKIAVCKNEPSAKAWQWKVTPEGKSETSYYVEEVIHLGLSYSCSISTIMGATNGYTLANKGKCIEFISHFNSELENRLYSFFLCSIFRHSSWNNLGEFSAYFQLIKYWKMTVVNKMCRTGTTFLMPTTTDPLCHTHTDEVNSNRR